MFTTIWRKASTHCDIAIFSVVPAMVIVYNFFIVLAEKLTSACGFLFLLFFIADIYSEDIFVNKKQNQM
jgi:hypothetical protein